MGSNGNDGEENITRKLYSKQTYPVFHSRSFAYVFVSSASRGMLDAQTHRHLFLIVKVLFFPTKIPKLLYACYVGEPLRI